MGRLIDGTWTQQGYDTESTGGAFRRETSRFRHWVTADGTPGPTGEGGFAAEAGRYHLYVSLACPWAHRTIIFRRLKGLDRMIGLSVVHWFMGAEGWTFADAPGTRPDTINGARCLHEVYTHADPHASGRVTVPVLWDTRQGTIVSNESADIIRMLNSAFDGVGASPGDYYPEALREEIDGYNARIYDTVNNGVYKAGFASAQNKYEAAVTALFDTLDWLESHLGRRRYLCGDKLTEADWRLFTTLLRFDPVYHGHFKCNLRKLAEYPVLHAYLRDLYQHDGVRETVDFEHIKNHYYRSHDWINPSRIVPAGPVQDLEVPHGRGALEG